MMDSKDFLKPRGDLFIEPYTKHSDGSLEYGKSFWNKNLVVNTGRDYLANHLSLSSVNHLVSYLSVGTDSTTPQVSDTTLRGQLSLDQSPPSDYLYRDEVISPTVTTTGVIELVFIVNGNLFELVGSTSVGEAGLFLEDGSNPGELLENPNPNLFSRTVFNPSIDVEPYSVAQVEKGFRLTWRIHF